MDWQWAPLLMANLQRKIAGFICKDIEWTNYLQYEQVRYGVRQNTSKAKLATLLKLSIMNRFVIGYGRD